MKTVLITGGTRGIGKSIAYLFAKNHYNLVLNYLKTKDQGEKIKKDLEEKYGISVLLVQGDISKEEDIERMVFEMEQTFSNIDCLINNAGLAIDTTIEDKTKENFMKTLDVNLIGPFLLSRAIGKRMQKQTGDHVIINITSTNGIDTFYPESIDYDASKAGLISLTHNLANYYQGKIRVNAVAPGWVSTEMNQNLESEFISQEEDKILLHRFADPDEIAKVVYFLASSDASYINDTIIRVDGGVKR